MASAGWRNIKVDDGEWGLVQQDARYWGLPAYKLLILAWRNWRSSGAELKLLPRPVVNPWQPKEIEKKAGGLEKR